jgi:hypothetical protein
METSNLIALAALIVAVVGLIPQFSQVFGSKKLVNHSPEEKQISPVEPVINAPPPNEIEDKKVEMSFGLRILLLIVFAVATFLIEIIIFGIIAYFCNVEVNIGSMTTMWNVIFLSLFFIPGAFLFLAFWTVVANTTD